MSSILGQFFILPSCDAVSASLPSLLTTDMVMHREQVVNFFFDAVVSAWKSRQSLMGLILESALLLHCASHCQFSI